MPMVLTVEIPQVHFLDKVVDMLVRCTTTGGHGLDRAAEPRGDSTGASLDKIVASLIVVRRQVPMA